MGIKRERDEIYSFQNIYNSLAFSHGKNTMRISGELKVWKDIEAISRIFYKKLEELFYSKDLLNTIYETSIRAILKKNGLLGKSFFDILKERNFHFETIKILLLKLDDFVYHNVRKHLQYSTVLSKTTNAVNELLENTIKYTSGKFSITVGLNSNSKYPLVIQLDNHYDNKNTIIKENLQKLKEDIEIINNNPNPEEAILQLIQRTASLDDEKKGESRLGLAKIKIDTGAFMKLELESKVYGKNGISITLGIPVELHTKEEIIAKYRSLLQVKK